MLCRGAQKSACRIFNLGYTSDQQLLIMDTKRLADG